LQTLKKDSKILLLLNQSKGAHFLRKIRTKTEPPARMNLSGFLVG
jgi:hypothetical protein